MMNFSPSQHSHVRILNYILRLKLCSILVVSKTNKPMLQRKGYPEEVGAVRRERGCLGRRSSHLVLGVGKEGGGSGFRDDMAAGVSIPDFGW